MALVNMLKTRIIPILTINGAMQVVKTIKFQRPYRVVGNLMQYIKIFEKRQIDELCILDIDASLESRLINYEKIKEFTKELYCPLTLGGGIGSLDDINKLLQSGADKVCINSHLFGNTSFVKNAANKFGSQAIVVSIDYLNKYEIKYGSFKISEIFRNEDFVTKECKYFESLGAGEILLTSIDRDGTYEGYDIDTIKSIADTCKIPIIANSGLNDLDNASKALKAGASALAGSSAFLFTDLTPRIMAEKLNKLGHKMRLQ